MMTKGGMLAFSDTVHPGKKRTNTSQKERKDTGHAQADIFLSSLRFHSTFSIHYIHTPFFPFAASSLLPDQTNNQSTEQGPSTTHDAVNNNPIYTPMYIHPPSEFFIQTKNYFEVQ